MIFDRAHDQRWAVDILKRADQVACHRSPQFRRVEERGSIFVLKTTCSKTLAKDCGMTIDR